MISVIIPASNHTASIPALIAFARFHPSVTEVIVVDDGANDYVSKSAESLRVISVPCTFMGKGSAMQDGLRAARNEIILFLDGDIVGLREDLIEAMAEPLLSGQADFVKSKQSRMRSHSMQTLVKTIFPELSHIEQPREGIFAARRPLLDSLMFDYDYGVHIGLLVDTALSGLHIAEVDVGTLEYEMQPLENLQEAAVQFLRSLCTRAVRYGRLHAIQERDVYAGCPLQAKELSILLEQARHPHRLALIDLDHVLLGTPLIAQLAQRSSSSLITLNVSINPALGQEDTMSMIAAFCLSSTRESLERAANTLAFRTGARELVSELRGAGYRVGLMSDGFHTTADILRRRLNADFCIAHTMKYDRDIATGKISVSPAMFHAEGCRLHTFCRRNILVHFCEKTGTQPEQILVIGGGRHDKCLLEATGHALSFQPETIDVRDAATMNFSSTLSEVLAEIFKDYAAK